MLEKSLQPNERLHDNPLGFSLQALATSLVEDGYADQTVRSKLRLLVELGRWFERCTVAQKDGAARRYWAAVEQVGAESTCDIG